MVNNNVHSSTKHMNFPSWPCHGGSGYAGYASCGKPKLHDDITKLQATLSIFSMSWTSPKRQINRIHQTFSIQHDLLVHKCNCVSLKIALNGHYPGLCRTKNFKIAAFEQREGMRWVHGKSPLKTLKASRLANKPHTPKPTKRIKEHVSWYPEVFRTMPQSVHLLQFALIRMSGDLQ